MQLFFSLFGNKKNGFVGAHLRVRLFMVVNQGRPDCRQAGT
jgi:hypothetical protein